MLSGKKMSAIGNIEDRACHAVSKRDSHLAGSNFPPATLVTRKQQPIRNQIHHVLIFGIRSLTA